MHVRKCLLNLPSGVGIDRRRRSLVSPFLDNSNSVYVILLSHELFSGDHQLIQVDDDAKGHAHSDGEVP